jgi:UDP-glucuronate 4-epimerase
MEQYFSQKTYIVTGSAGFIGFHVAKKILEFGGTVVGVDNFNEYYDPQLKEDRNAILEKFPRYTLKRGDIADLSFVKSIFSDSKIDAVCHLGAQAGVRYSIKNPYAYIDSNVTGFTHVINEAKNAGIKNFIFASSSSVYGDQETSPFSENAPTDSPISLYAATKKANELVAHTYHHLYGMNCTGLRFFTVYGPWSRPDMAMILFANSIYKGEKIKVFNEGKMKRDFTYIDDIVNGILLSLEKCAPFEIINLGNNKPVELSYMISLLEKEIGKQSEKELLPIQPGDVLHTYANISKAKELLGWEPVVGIEEGIKMFVDWYRSYYLT